TARWRAAPAPDARWRAAPAPDARWCRSQQARLRDHSRGRCGTATTSHLGPFGGRFSRLDTPPGDSHLMLSVAKAALEIRFAKTLGSRLFTESNDPTSAPCGSRANERTACKGAQQKETGHDYSKTPAIDHLRRKPLLSGAAAARHRRLPAHDRAAIRRPREIDPCS